MPIEAAPAIMAAPLLRRSALLNIAARLCGAALAFVLTVALARSMEPAGFAQISVALAWLAVATVLGCLGMPLAVVRFLGENLAQGRPDRARGALVFSLCASSLAAALLTGVAGVALHAGLGGLTPQALKVADLGLALVLPNVLLTVLAGILQGLNHAVVAETLSSILRSLLMLAGIATLWPGASGPRLAADTVFSLYLWVAVTLLFVAAALAFRVQRRLMPTRETSYQSRLWLDAGFGLLAVLVAMAASERIDLIMLGWNAGPDQVAVYAVAQRFGQTVLLAVNALAAVLAPQFVGCLPLLRAGQAAPAQEVVRTAARWTLWTCLAAWLFFAAFGPWFTVLFGHGYSAAYLPLMILLTGQVLVCLFGPSLMVATLSGHVQITLASVGTGMLLNAFLNWISVPHWGAVGAALATSAGGLVSAAIAQAAMRRRLGIIAAAFGPLPSRAVRTSP